MSQRLMPIDEIYIFNRRYIHIINDELFGGINDAEKQRGNWWIFFIVIMVTLTWMIPLILLEPITVGILNWKGESVDATITTLQEGRQTPIDFFTHGTVAYRYTPEDAEEAIYWTQPVVEDTFSKLNLGDTVRIRYSPEFPDFARLAGDDADAATIINAFIVLLGTIVIYLFAWRMIVHPDMVRIRLEKNGEVLLGELIGYYLNESSTAKMNPFRSGPRATIQYRFINPEGDEVVKTQEGVVNNAQNNVLEPTAGTEIAILYVNPTFYRVL